MTSKLFQASQVHSARTENGAVTHKSSLSKVVDFYQIVGASRNHVGNVSDPFLFSLREDKDLAVRIMLHARDIRQGMGERAVGVKINAGAVYPYNVLVSSRRSGSVGCSAKLFG